jgi:hypothetical protein
MQSTTLLSSRDEAPLAHFADLQANLIDYACRIGELRTPNDVLDALHVVTTKGLPLRVLGAVARDNQGETPATIRCYGVSGDELASGELLTGRWHPSALL